MICPKCQTNNPISATYCSHCQYVFNNDEKENAYNETIYGQIDKIIDNIKKIIGILNLSIIFNNRIFRAILLILLLTTAIYLKINHQQYAIIPSDEYTIEYNQHLNEYYLYTNNDYINLNLYLNKDVDEIIINTYTVDGININNSIYTTSDNIILNKTEDMYYQIIENDNSFIVYIIENRN